MASKTFIKLDEDLLHDQKIRDLIRVGGYKDFGLYIALLTIMRNYDAQAYRIPYAALDDISLWDLATSKDDIETMVSHCIDVGLLNSSPDEFWSPRRVEDLMAQKAQSEACRAAAARTNALKKLKKGEQATQRDFSAIVAGIHQKCKL